MPIPRKGRPKKGRTSRTVVPPVVNKTAPVVNKTAPVIVINKRDNHDLPKKKEDRISQLPDHILITILSQLSLCEAATSSLLSKRWISLWTRVTSLCFDPLVYTLNWKVYDRDSRLRKVEAERSKCRSWVNQVLQSYQGSTLDQFQLTLHPDSECVADIDNWIDFAIRKKVQRLHLRLDMPFCPKFCYTFPDKVFIHLKTPPSCITNLTTLYLRNIHITDQHLEYFLSKSPLLERLYLGYVFNLNHLNVAAPRLKFLQLFHCWGLQTLELFVPNLVSFIYQANQKGTKILIKHAPSLVQVWLDDNTNITSLDFQRTLSCFSHLETLTLCMDPLVKIRLLHLPEFTCLKNLTFRVSYHSDYVLAWTSLIERAPSLHQFTLQVLGESVMSHISLAPEFRHECLKVVELCGFNGKSVDTDVATYLIQIPIALDKIIIDLHGWDYTAERRAPMEKTKVKKLRECALQLKTRLPPGAELLII